MKQLFLKSSQESLKNCPLLKKNHMLLFQQKRMVKLQEILFHLKIYIMYVFLFKIKDIVYVEAVANLIIFLLNYAHVLNGVIFFSSSYFSFFCKIGEKNLKNKCPVSPKTKKNDKEKKSFFKIKTIACVEIVSSLIISRITSMF